MNASTLNRSSGLIHRMSLQARITEAVNAALAKGLSLADVARVADVTQSALTQWMDGTTKSLKASSAAGLERATGYRAAWLGDGKGRKLLDHAPVDNSATWSPQARASAAMIDKLQSAELRQEVADIIQSAVLDRFPRAYDADPPPVPSDPPIGRPGPAGRYSIRFGSRPTSGAN